MKKWIRKFTSLVTDNLSWVALGLAVCGGCAMALTFLGALVGNVVRTVGNAADAIVHSFAPNVSIHLGMLIAVGWGIGALVDIIADGSPDKPAILAAVFVPSIAATGLSGRVGDWARQHTHLIADGVNHWASVWLGGPGILAAAVLGIYLASRVQKKANGRNAAGMPAGMR